GLLPTQIILCGPAGLVLEGGLHGDFGLIVVFCAGGREAPPPPHEKRNFCGIPARHWNGEQLRGISAAGTSGDEQDVFAVRSPATGHIVRGVPGETPRLAAGSGDDEHIRIAVIVGGEGDPLAVWREIRIKLRSDTRRKPQRIAAIAAYRPDIAGIGKRDLVTAHARMANQKGFGGIRKARGGLRNQAKCQRQIGFHRDSLKIKAILASGLGPPYRSYLHRGPEARSWLDPWRPRLSVLGISVHDAPPGRCS